MTTLTDRYLADVARRLPASSRDDITDEIRATIADMADAHPGAPTDVERDVLTELGSPAELARRYSERPQHLIGPDLYPAWVKAMAWTLPIVVVVQIVASTVGYAYSDDAPRLGELIGEMVGRLVVTLFVAGGIVTLVVAVIDHFLTGSERDEVVGSLGVEQGWSVDDLPEEPGRTEQRVESVISIVAALLMLAVPFVPASFFYVPDVPEGEGFLHPDLWSLWIPLYLVLGLLMAGVELARFVRRGTTTGVAIAHSAIGLAFAVFITLLVTTQTVLNPNLPVPADSVGQNPTLTIVLLVVWGVTAWDLVDTYQRRRREASLAS